MNKLLRFGLLSLLAVLGGCSQFENLSYDLQKKPPGKVAIIVDLDDQHAYLLKGGEVVLTGGGLAAVITNEITLGLNNKITFTNAALDTNKFTLTITKSTGVISGAFANPLNSKQTTKVNGVLLQNQTNAEGYFIIPGQTQGGSFLLVP